MLKKIIIQLWTLLHVLPGIGQKMYLQTITELDAELGECSGVVALPDDRLLMINDSGNEPAIYFTDSTGNILNKQRLPFATNRDWEDLALSSSHLFVGDFGNNSNKRKDLLIYRVGMEGDSLYDDGEIKFSYGTQHNFPPEEENMNYDLEAMIHFNDSIFLFSKNRTEPFTGYTYQYGMPAKPGQYELFPLDSFKTGEGLMESFWVGAAAISPSKDQLVLLGYDKLWLFRNFSGSRFLQGDAQTFHFKDLTQKESVDFLSEYKLAITDEGADFFGGGYLYYASLPAPDEPVVDVYPKEFQDSLVVDIRNHQGKVLWEIYTTDGERPLAGNFMAGEKATTEELKVADLPAGGYVINIIINGQPHAYKLKKLLIPGGEKSRN